ncbi:hypothetical protein LOAG_13481, partial [Loa loa]
KRKDEDEDKREVEFPRVVLFRCSSLPPHWDQDQSELLYELLEHERKMER